MSSAPSAHDGLAGLPAPAEIRGRGATIALLPLAAMVSIIARKNGLRDLAAQMRAEYGLELPLSPGAVAAGDLQLVWAGVQHWLLLAPSANSDAFERRARDGLGSCAAISNQSDSRVRLLLEGPGARDVLAKGLPLDLHPSVFKVGDAAASLFDHIGVHVWLRDTAPSFEMLVARSYAPSLMTALRQAAG